MTIEQKAQRYDEALERMKSWVRGEHPECFTEAQKAAEFIFPELKESEDELKWLTQFIQEETYNLSMDIRDDEDRIKLKNLQRSLAWLEKQSEKPQGKSALEAIKEEKVDNANKIETKFHEGEWVVWLNKCYKVNYKSCGYELVDQNGLSTSLEYGTIDENAHLWTIQDAKDGDVLYSPCLSLLWIFKSIDTVYCGCNLNYNDGAFCGEGYFERPTDAIPAIKEQYDTFFAKLKEAGYEWDAEKKELKKIEPIRAWSEEDALRLEEVICMIEANGRWVRSDDAVKLVLEWLKSLKERIGDRKMKQEEIKILENVEKKIQEKEEAVLDPFIGSGTTALACMRSKRHYIGCEIDPKYYKVALERIDREKRTLTLF